MNMLALLSPPRGVRGARSWLLVLALLAGGAAAVPAQATLGDMRRQATRAELEAAARAAETAVASAPDEKTRQLYRETASIYRQRLQNGDFVPGDRILLQVVSDSVFSDTFTVRADRRLPLPNIPEISLHGVLDSELEDHLTKELSKYLKNVELTATVLLRLSVIGAVGRQDFMTVPVDLAITDVVTNAGGFAGVPDLGKAVVRRGTETVIDSRSLQEAFQRGKTVGDLSLRDGDVLYIPAIQQSGVPKWQQVAAAVGSLTGLYFLIRYGVRRGRP
jgi:protein involved in polysaccharide export with SLBB domain